MGIYIYIYIYKALNVLESWCPGGRRGTAPRWTCPPDASAHNLTSPVASKKRSIMINCVQ